MLSVDKVLLMMSYLSMTLFFRLHIVRALIGLIKIDIIKIDTTVFAIEAKWRICASVCHTIIGLDHGLSPVRR